MVLVGITTTDTHEDVSRLAKKIAGLRLFEDLSSPPPDSQKWYGKPWSKSLLADLDLCVLSISQFTLYATVKKGTKPDFHKAAKGPEAKVLYEAFLGRLRAELGAEERVKDGVFGEMMEVLLVNDGPVTIVWDTKED